MKISAYIAKLENVMAEVGDVEVQHDGPWRRMEAIEPKVGYALILKGRENKPRFWSGYYGDERKGSAVCRI